jgi:hypothetical protein
MAENIVHELSADFHRGLIMTIKSVIEIQENTLHLELDFSFILTHAILDLDI